LIDALSFIVCGELSLDGKSDTEVMHDVATHLGQCFQLAGAGMECAWIFAAGKP
jgi:hypothetical protein